MHFVALLLVSIGSAAAAAPAAADRAPPGPGVQKPAVELTLSGELASILEVTIRNNTRAPITLRYKESPFEVFAVEIRAADGTRVVAADAPPADPTIPFQVVTVPPGGTARESLETCHFLAPFGGKKQRLTFVARAVVGGVAVESPPLAIDR